MELSEILSVIGILYLLIGAVMYWISLSSSKMNYMDELEYKKVSTLILVLIFWPVLLF